MLLLCCMLGLGKFRVKHFATHTIESHISALVSLLVVLVLALIQLFYMPQNDYMLSAIISATLFSVYQPRLFGKSINLKLIMGLIISLLLGVVVFLASYLYYLNFVGYTLVLVILLMLTCMSCCARLHISAGVWILTDIYIVFSGFSGDVIHALYTGVFASLAGLLLVLVLWLKNFIFHPKRYRTMRKEALFPKHSFHLSKGVFLYSLRLVVAVLCALIISYYFDLFAGFWVPMTVFVVMKPSIHKTLNALKHRLWGTIIGAMLALPIVLYIHSSIIILLILLICIYGIVITLAKHYGAYTFFLTLGVIITPALGHYFSEKMLLEARVSATFIGLITVMVIVLFAYSPKAIKKLMKNQ